MTNNTTTKIDTGMSYTMIDNRCKDAAKYLMPDLPKKNTIEAWEAFQSELEDFDLYSVVSEEVENWDWVIYTHYGWKILHLMTPIQVDEAEEQFLDYNHGLEIQELGGGFDIWFVQSQIAYHLLINLVTEYLQELISEYEDVADMAITNLEES